MSLSEFFLGKDVFCRNFILCAVATFWAMWLVGIYPVRASAMVPRENKNNAYAKFGGPNKEYYGIFGSGL